MPPYSPFLNPCEEVFAQIKYGVWKDYTETGIEDTSVVALKKSFAKQLTAVTQSDINGYYAHTERFIHDCLNQLPIFARSLYESSHLGDEKVFCPM
jgi:hypothetical protein